MPKYLYTLLAQCTADSESTQLDVIAPSLGLAIAGAEARGYIVTDVLYNSETTQEPTL